MLDFLLFYKSLIVLLRNIGYLCVWVLVYKKENIMRAYGGKNKKSKFRQTDLNKILVGLLSGFLGMYSVHF